MQIALTFQFFIRVINNLTNLLKQADGVKSIEIDNISGESNI